MHNLILASQSPRRKQLLKEHGFCFRVDTVKVSEIIDENLNLLDALKQVARAKAQAVINSSKYLKSGNNLVLAADTVVVLEGEVLGKPKDAAEAVNFLTRLSGKTHSVMTAVCLWEWPKDKVVTVVEETKVRFRVLSEKEIKDYVATGEPLDKAGAYGIQGHGASFVEHYTGSWTNIVGLPMEKLEELLKENGWHIDREQIA